MKFYFDFYNTLVHGALAEWTKATVLINKLSVCDSKSIRSIYLQISHYKLYRQDQVPTLSYPKHDQIHSLDHNLQSGQATFLYNIL